MCYYLNVHFQSQRAKVSLQCMHFEFLFFVCSTNSSDLTYRYPTACSHSPCHGRVFYIIGGRAFLGTFAKLRKATISFLVSVVLFVRMEQLGSHWTDFGEILYLRIFRKSFGKIQVSLKSDKNEGYFT